MKLRIKELCKEKSLTIGDLSDKMQIARESLSRTINGNPTLETLEKIATALNVPISNLFESERELYGLVTFKGKIYKVDSLEALQSLYNDCTAKV